jgi:YbbR domain-containing protein
VSWITSDWRLKLLALGLAALMLGAVAFSQNPPTSKTLSKNIDYSSLPANLIVINPPARTSVTVAGLADLISSVTSSSVVASVDLSKAKPGPNVNANLVAKSLVPGVTVQNPVVPIALNIDQRAKVQLTVNVRTPNVLPGWQVNQQATYALCPSKPCSVQFDGPVSWEANLKAYVDFTNPVQFATDDVPTQPVVLEQNGSPLDLTRPTLPKAGLDITTVAIHIEATTGITTRQVPLIDSPPSSLPPTCYRITGIAIDPIAVTITGSPTDLSQITNITLPAVPLSRSTSNATFRVTVTYPAGITGSAATARVTYSIAQNPNCSSPSP